ncbi:hypothetical protein [Xanthomonas sacchari]|uniref:hypothetical protein n=1 Tax=Xanthomonas sacchari TaxID=56458 RepID=UPI00225DECBB|nr:hypothetical protein [Xanthomonas sacchari]
MKLSDKNSFCVAAFSADGSLVGTHQWEISSLSSRWLDVCIEYLDHHGTSFNAPWSGSLAHISTQFTSSEGVALVTFSSNGRPEASILLASGKSKEADLSVMKLFINSLVGVEFVQNSANIEEPFREMLSISERPLMVVVAWGDEGKDSQVYTVIRELSLHLAAAYFLINK